MGWVELEDLERGTRRLINTGSRAVRDTYARESRERRRRVERTLAQARCPMLEVRTDRSYLPTLIRYFAARARPRHADDAATRVPARGRLRGARGGA